MLIHFIRRNDDGKEKKCSKHGKKNENRKEIARKSYLKSQDQKLDDVLMKRYVPVEIYLDTDDPAALETVNESVRKVLEEIDLEAFSEPEIFKGSIIEKFWVVTKSITSNLDLIKKIANFVSSIRKERSITVNDKLLSKSETPIKISETLKDLKDIPNISIRVGSLLITKSTSRDIPVIQIKTLTREESLFIDSNPGVLKNPGTIHNRLNRMKQERIISSHTAMNL